MSNISSAAKGASASDASVSLSFCHGTTTNRECIFFARTGVNTYIGDKLIEPNRRVVVRVQNCMFTSVAIIEVSTDQPGSPFVDYSKFPKWTGDAEHQDGEEMMKSFPVTRSHPRHDQLRDILYSNGYTPSHCYTTSSMGYSLAMVEDRNYEPFVEDEEGKLSASKPKHNVLCVYIRESSRFNVTQKQNELRALMRMHGANIRVGDRKVTYYAKMLKDNGMNMISTISVKNFIRLYRHAERICVNPNTIELVVANFTDIQHLHDGWMKDSPTHTYIERGINEVTKEEEYNQKTTNLQFPVCWFDFEQGGQFVTNVDRLDDVNDTVMMCSFGMFGKPSTCVIMDGGEITDIPPEINRMIHVPYGNHRAFWKAILDTFIYYDADVYMAWNGNGYDFVMMTIRIASTLYTGYQEHRVNGLFTTEFLLSEMGNGVLSEVFSEMSVLSVPEEGANIQKLYGKTSSFLKDPFTLHVSGVQFVDAMIANIVVEPYQPSYSLKESAIRRKVKEKEGPSYVELARAYVSMRYWGEVRKCTHLNAGISSTALKRYIKPVCCGGGALHVDESGTYITECDCSSEVTDTGIASAAVLPIDEVVEYDIGDDVGDDVENDTGDDDDEPQDAKGDKITAVAKIRTLKVPCTKICPLCMFRANNSNFITPFGLLTPLEIKAIYGMRIKDQDLYDYPTALAYWAKSIKYVMNDTEVMMQIALSVSMVPGLIAMCNQNHTTLSKIVAGQTARFVNLFYWASVDEGLHYIDNQLKKNGPMYGGQVTPNICGIFGPVFDLDANSLYPSEMIEGNFDPSTHVHDAILDSFNEKFASPSSMVTNTFRFTTIDVSASIEAKADEDGGEILSQAATRKVGGFTFKGPDGYIIVQVNPVLRITTNVRRFKAMNYPLVDPAVDTAPAIAALVEWKRQTKIDKNTPKPAVIGETVDAMFTQCGDIVKTFVSDDSNTTYVQEFYENTFRNNMPDCPDHDDFGVWYATYNLLPKKKEQWIAEIRTENKKRSGKGPDIPGVHRRIRWYVWMGIVRRKSDPAPMHTICVYKVYYTDATYGDREPIDIEVWSVYRMKVTNFKNHIVSFRQYTYLSHIKGKAPIIEADLLSARARVRKVDMVSPEAKANPQLMLDLDAKQKALKETANSMYGARGTNGEHYNEADQASITGMGRQFIQEAIMEQASLGFMCIYSDTDSNMSYAIVKIPPELVYEFGDKLQKEINKRLSERYKNLRVGFDGIFDVAIFTNPKKYVFLQKGEVEVKGLMMKKRDQTKWAKITAREAFDMRIRGAQDEDVIAYVASRKKLVDELVITEEGITGEVPILDMCKRVFLTDETKQTPQVQVAERLTAAGFKVARGDMIDFFRMIDGMYGSPLILSDVLRIDLSWVKSSVDADILGLMRAMKYTKNDVIDIDEDTESDGDDI